MEDKYVNSNARTLEIFEEILNGFWQVGTIKELQELDLGTRLKELYRILMTNEIVLQEKHPLDSNKRPLKIDGQVSSLEIASKGRGARVTGNLDCQGDISVDNIATANTVTFHNELALTVTTGTVKVAWALSQKQSLTITGTGCTIDFYDPVGVCNLILKVVQGDGSDTVGTWDSDIKWAGGTAPTLSTGSGDIDIISFYFDGDNYYGVASLDFG